MATGSFVHLHCHTHYSLLDGANRIPELVAHAKGLGMNALAMTDHGNLYGAIEFYRECKAGGLNPVVGYEAYVAPNTRFDRDARKRGEAGFHLTLLAQNRTGFKNLLKLASVAFLEGYYYVPRIDKELLAAHSEGLICLSGCASAEFSEHILAGRMEEAEKLADWFATVFGKNFYVEIQNNGLQIQKLCAEGAIDIARKKGLPLVATSDAHYLTRADAPAHDVLLCINTGAKRAETKRMRYGDDNGRLSDQFYIRSPQEMYDLFPEHAEAVQRSQEIADGVHLDLDFKARHFPVFVPPEKKTPEDYLRELCEQGLMERYKGNPPQAARDRLAHELGIICRMGFASYFLIVSDFVRFAVEKGIPCSARGSGCGALVSYVLKLSHVDPLDYDLLFERFLDPNRAEAPDIDIDFCQLRREEVIAYVKQKYGEESVAQIATFGTLAARAAIKDVGRVLDVPLERVNQLTSLIPTTLHITIDESLEQVPDLKQMYDSDPVVRELIDIARKLEGTNRNTGTHAAGVVISNGPLSDYVPLQKVVRKGEDGTKKSGESVVTTQWVMGDLEKVGLLKMDFLGLRTLSLVEECLALIEKTRGEKINVFDLPLDDRATYQLLQRGDAKGVFQFESDGIRELLKRLKPDNIRDIIACTALYRPGPLQGGMVDSYINRKHGREEPEYAHPVMQEVLEETYGIMCIHEDARVSLADGTEKPIREVRIGDRVHTLNLASRRFEVRACHGCGPTRRGDGVRITLENGFSVTLTDDHDVHTWGGWKKAGELDPAADLVTVALELAAEPTHAGLAPWLGEDEDVAYLFGLLVGDGCLTGTGITVATGTQAQHERLLAWLRVRLPALRLNPYFHQRSWYVTLSCGQLLGDPDHGNRKTRLHHLLETHGLKKTAREKRVPEAIFRSPPVVRSAFLAGLFDSDGCLSQTEKGAAVAFVTSASPELLQDLRRLFQLAGVAVRLTAQRIQVWNVVGLKEAIEPHLVIKAFTGKATSGGTYGRLPRSVLVGAVAAGESQRAFCQRTGIQSVGFRHRTAFIKSSTAAKAGIEQGDVRHLRIASLERVTDQQFYGMSVADHHNLVADGVVVKNCYQEQIMRILNKLGGIELSSAYACIKAISKKKQEIIDQRKADFFKGAIERGIAEATAKDIFEKIVFFGGYGFNKCLVGSTTVIEADTGERATLEDLHRRRRPFTVHALGDDWRLGRRAVVDVIANGRKPVFKLCTAQGKRIVATDNHPFRTLNGWTLLRDLNVGDLIASPRRLEVAATESWPEHEIVSLAGLLSEGNLCHPTSLYFYGNDEALIDDFVRAATRFPDSVARVYRRPTRRCLEVCVNTGSAAIRRQGTLDGGGVAVAQRVRRCGAFQWAERLGILGHKATEKFVPEGVFLLRDADVELFLGRLWSGDGYIANADQFTPYYATSSARLATDVQTLLLRLGIVSGIHTKAFKYRGGTRPGYTVHLLGEDSVRRFLDRVCPHTVGREAAVGRLRAYLDSVAEGLPSKDVVPVAVREWVDEERRKAGLTWRQLEDSSGVCVKDFVGVGPPSKRGFRRGTVARLAAFFASTRLERLATSDVFWDRVVSIEPAGEADTFDLTVEGDHNFVANGLVVHNSHSAAYALVSYQTAYLKQHYTPEFMAALLSSEIDDGNKRDIMVDHIADAKKMGVEVLPPCVNASEPTFSVLGSKIVIGLLAIKGLGHVAAQEIVRARKEGGPFKDLYDFCERIDVKSVPRAAIEKLIKGGALDRLGGHRAQFMQALPRALQAAAERQQDAKLGQGNLFEALGESGSPESTGPEPLPDVPMWPEADKLKYEKEALDFYFSSHPLAQAEKQLQRLASHTVKQVATAQAGQEIVVGGMLSQVRFMNTQKARNGNTRYLRCKIEDLTGVLECVMWPSDFARNKEPVADDRIVFFRGARDERSTSSEPIFLISQIIGLEQMQREACGEVWLRLKLGQHQPYVVDTLASILKRYPGTTPVMLSVVDSSGRRVAMRLGRSFSVNPLEFSPSEVEDLLGPESVKLVTGNTRGAR